MSRRFLSIVVALVSLVWASLTFYSEIILEDPDQYSIKSARVKQEMANCSGTFAQRQECAERITDAQEQLGFLVWCEKLAIILGPPLVLWGLLGYSARQRRTEPEMPAAPRRLAGGTGRTMHRPATPRGPERDPRGPLPFDEAESPMGEAPEPGLAPRPISTGEPPPPSYTGPRREPVRRRDR